MGHIDVPAMDICTEPCISNNQLQSVITQSNITGRMATRHKKDVDVFRQNELNKCSDEKIKQPQLLLLAKLFNY